MTRRELDFRQTGYQHGYRLLIDRPKKPTPSNSLAVAADAAIAARAAKGRAEHDDERYRAEPEAFCREILGSSPWTREQARVAGIIQEAALSGASCQVLSLGGHGTGKSYLQDAMTLWVWGPVSRQLDGNGEPQGCDVILTAPTGGNIERTSYYTLVELGRIAASNGYRLAGWAPRPGDGYRGASAASVRWAEGPWRMVAINPRVTAAADVAHAAGGMHHRHRAVIRMEEALGIPPGMVQAGTGLAAAGNVLMLAATNPTSMSGFFYGHVRANPEAWTLVGHSQVNHVNVIRREKVIPGSASHVEMEKALRSPRFEDRGPASSTDLDEARLDFVYACPDPEMEDVPGPRPDGIPGHPDADPRVFRPADEMAAGQFLGNWLEADVGALLFHVPQIAARMATGAWRQPGGPPDQVGLDCAPTRCPVACPRWGPPARTAIDAKPRAEPGTIHLGRPHEAEWMGGDANEKADTSAAALIAKYGTSPTYYLDQAFGGEVGQALRSLGAPVVYVPFGEKPVAKPLEAYGPVRNRRAEIYVEAAAVLNSGVADLPHSTAVLDQMRATGALQTSADRATSKVIRKKEDVERDLGRSPDDLDSACLALATGRTINRIRWDR